jgi:hypothetical protein
MKEEVFRFVDILQETFDDVIHSNLKENEKVFKLELLESITYKLVRDFNIDIPKGKP